MRKAISLVLGFVVFGCIGWIVYWAAAQAWHQFTLLDPKVSVGLLTAASTVLVATLTVVLGKYYERKKDIEAHYREKKTQIYDEFLAEFFKTFDLDGDDGSSAAEMVAFFREWQRKIILWGGQDVLTKYIAWMNNLKQGNATANTLFMMEEFFLEIRKDLGHSNNKLRKGTFIYLILQNAELFLALAKENPDLTLEQLAEAERELGLTEPPPV